MNLFFENSTRTKASFEIAAKSLSAEVLNISVANSSIKKGETLIDTASTLNAMKPDFLILRHPNSWTSKSLTLKNLIQNYSHQTCETAKILTRKSLTSKIADVKNTPTKTMQSSTVVKSFGHRRF